MMIKLDRDSPVPLYHQLAEGLRYLIATGRLAAGQAMPPVREGQSLFGVNMHTVRRAYAELSRDGLVTTDGPRGTRVTSRAGTQSPDVQRFVADMLRKAKAKFGLSPADFAQLLMGQLPQKTHVRTPVYVLECSETQCADLAVDLTRAWDVDANPWCLSREGEPPPGVLVATYFHYNEIRLRWPHRHQNLRFITIRPDAAVIRELRVLCPNAPTIRVTLCERDQAMATNIIADLGTVFGNEQLDVTASVTPSPTAFLASHKGNDPVLFSPRVWGELDTALRRDPRAVQVQYVFDSKELDRLAEELDWPRRVPARARPKTPRNTNEFAEQMQANSK